MEVPQRLLDVLPEQCLEKNLSKIDEWNELVEKLLSSSPEKQVAEAQKSTSIDALNSLTPILPQVSLRLHKLLLVLIDDDTSYRMAEVLIDDEETATNLTTEAVASWREVSNEQGGSKLGMLSVLLRASKNWLRWNLQIYSAVSPTAVTPDPLRRLKSRPMLDFCMLLLEQYCNSQEALARQAAYLLFYATYNPVPSSDESIQETFEYLTNDLHFFKRILTFLLRIDTASVALSLVRNVHNILVSYPKAGSLLEETKIELTEKFASCPWVPANGPLMYKAVFRDIIVWALQANETFPGEKGDVRAELIVEVLRCFYVLRVGADLSVPPQDGRLSQVVLDLLYLNTEDERCCECQIATVSLLMDSNSSFSVFLLENNAVDSLLDVLERQVTRVLEANQIDNSAAAALTPILIVLHKFCNANTDYRRVTKERIFPPEAKPNFWRLAEEEQQRHGTAKNMSPLDAPEDTLRWKLVKLLTWPQGHIKRFTGELLWILCDGGSQEFIFRVGMGNALPVLGLKGSVQLPSQ